jgi:hypothetical protein
MRRASWGFTVTSLLLIAPGSGRGGFIDMPPTAVTQAEFVADFKPVNDLLSTNFTLTAGEAAGTLSAQVFVGTVPADKGIYAYLYQVMAPGKTQVNDLFVTVSDLAMATITIAGKDTKVNSIDINAGVTANKPVGGFKTLGGLAPLIISGNAPKSVLVTYLSATGAGAAIPAGMTGYIVGVFSTLPPITGPSLITTGKKMTFPKTYVTPEPSSLVLSVLAAIVSVAYFRLSPRGSRRAA